MPAQPKPQKSTPESRRQRREQVRQIKREFRPELFWERIRDQEQTPVVTADPAAANDFRLINSRLRTISKDKLEAHKGEKLYSTFKRKPGRHTLFRVRRKKGHRIKTVRQRTNVLKPGSKLKQRSVKKTAQVKDLASLKAQMMAVWGERCVFDFLGGCKGPLEMMHGYSVGAHPERALDIANVLPGCIGHHRLNLHNCHNHNPMDAALKAAVDLITSALHNKRPQPSWEEVQGEVRRELSAKHRLLHLRGGDSTEESV